MQTQLKSNHAFGEPKKLLLNKHELAALLGCSWRHVQNLTAARAIPHIRLGRCVRYSWPAVERQLERLTVKAI